VDTDYLTMFALLRDQLVGFTMRDIERLDVKGRFPPMADGNGFAMDVINDAVR
jgi:hypothetical protein